MTGIGRATAIALAKAGWSVVLFARRLEQLRETREQCEDPERCLCFEGDVTNELSVQELFRFTLSKLGMDPALVLCRTLHDMISLQAVWICYST